MQSLNGWTFAFNDYYELNVTRYVDTPNLDAMAAIVDPYSRRMSSERFLTRVSDYVYVGYLDRYRKMKILQIQTSGDEFFLPDNEVNREGE